MKKATRCTPQPRASTVPASHTSTQNVMTIALPAPITAFFNAHNSGETEHLLDLFTADAVVADESHEYRGEAIRGWMDDAVSKYSPLRADVASVASLDDQTDVLATVSGSFPGSPVQLCYRFVLREGKISSLAIGAP